MQSWQWLYCSLIIACFIMRVDCVFCAGLRTLENWGWSSVFSPPVFQTISNIFSYGEKFAAVYRWLYANWLVPSIVKSLVTSSGRMVMWCMSMWRMSCIARTRNDLRSSLTPYSDGTGHVCSQNMFEGFQRNASRQNVSNMLIDIIDLFACWTV